MQTDAQMKSYERNGDDRYIFLAEPTACPHCRKLDDQDFAVKDAMPGENAPPLHPHCNAVRQRIMRNGVTNLLPETELNNCQQMIICQTIIWIPTLWIPTAEKLLSNY